MKKNRVFSAILIALFFSMAVGFWARAAEPQARITLRIQAPGTPRFEQAQVRAKDAALYVVVKTVEPLQVQGLSVMDGQSFVSQLALDTAEPHQANETILRVTPAVAFQVMTTTVTPDQGFLDVNLMVQPLAAAGGQNALTPPALAPKGTTPQGAATPATPAAPAAPVAAAATAPAAAQTPAAAPADEEEDKNAIDEKELIQRPAQEHAAAKMVGDTIVKVLRILKKDDYRDETKRPPLREKIRLTILKNVDMNRVCDLVLAANRKSFQEAEYKQFQEAFSRLLFSTYITHMEKYSGEKVIIQGAQEATGSELRVKVVTKTVSPSDNKEIPIEYSLLKSGETWKLYDVRIEGMSLVQNYRTQFQEILSKGTPAELIKRVEERSINNDPKK
ncbi:MAG TPA: ABC transporter substrate-binding protein [Candidatus Sumerlaeota bacterium]|nr:ABC transporter substrate-binding protein [Candidatus Sumerlaeota bacterium]HPS01432.1 ABC transporter substrate-binding protein [Candidatus Sumerlaeota bacterium]